MTNRAKSIAFKALFLANNYRIQVTKIDLASLSTSWFSAALHYVRNDDNLRRFKTYIPLHNHP